MFIDVVNAGWIPIYNLNLSDDVIGYTGAPANALDYPCLDRGPSGPVTPDHTLQLPSSAPDGSCRVPYGPALV